MSEWISVDKQEPKNRQKISAICKMFRHGRIIDENLIIDGVWYGDFFRDDTGYDDSGECHLKLEYWRPRK